MTNHPNRNKSANMQAWSNRKLEKELAFAVAAKDENAPDTLAWAYACEVEADRRSRMSEVH
jgi:hypothetical protein